MTYRPVIDQFHLPIPLDPVCVVLFALAFVVAALLCARRASYGLVLLILAQPFDLSRDILGTTISLPKVVLLGVLVGLATYSGVLRLARDRPAPLLFLAIGAYLAATLLSFAGAEHPAATLQRASKSSNTPCCSARRISTGSIRMKRRSRPRSPSPPSPYRYRRSRRKFSGAPSGLYVGAAIVPRIAGVLEGPNQLAGYLEVALATLGALAIARRRALVDVALAIATCADVLTFSRAGLFGLLLVGAVLVAVSRGDALRALRPALAGFVAGLFGVGGWIAYAHSADVLRVSFGAPEYAGGVGNRGELYRAALRMFLRHPLAGVGAGNYKLSLADYGVAGVRTHANSWYLQSLARAASCCFWRRSASSPPR